MRALPYIAMPLVVALAFAAMSCGRDSGRTATPLRYAYPRVAVYDSIYSPADVGPVTVDVNAAAEPTSPRPGWLDISYRRYGTTLYLSAIHTDDPASSVANRRERIALNLGGAKATTHTFTAGSYECVVVESADAATTPVQLLAVSPCGIVVSGTAVLSSPSASADSIRPVVATLTRDAIHLLMSLDKN